MRDEAFNVANLQYDAYQRALASMVYNFFDKKSTNTSDGAVKSEIWSKQELANELHKPIIKNCKKRKVYSSWDNIMVAGIFPSSSTNVRFWKKIEFSNVIFRKKQPQNYSTMKEGVWGHCKLRSGSTGEPCWGFRG